MATFTVTATQSGSSSNRGVYLKVLVLTNAVETGGATSGSTNASGAVASGSLTPAFSNSFVGFSIAEDGVAGGLSAAATNNTYDYTNADATDGWSSAQGHYTGTVTASSALTYGESTFSSGDHSNWCAYEVPASGGAWAIDGSSPAGVNTTTLTAITTASFTPPNGAVLVALVTAGGTGSGTGITVTMTDTSGLGLTWTRRAISSTSDSFQPCYVFTTTLPGGSGPPVQGPRPQRGGKRYRSHFGHRMTPQPALLAPQVVTANAGVATAAATAVPVQFGTYITGLASTTGTSYFLDNHGNPRMWLGDEIWALLTNAGRWNSGNYQSTFDTYFATRAAQGYTICYSDMFNSTFIGGATNGQMWNTQTPFTSNNPSSGLNNSYWTVIDYALNSAKNNGITIALSFGGHWDWDTSGNAMFGFTSTQYTDAGNAIGTRYKNQPNLIWLIMDDYFGSFDSSLSSLLTGLRASGDTHPIAIENYAESSSRFTLDTSTSLTWGAANTQYNFGYSYSESYLCIEYMFAESSPLSPIYGDGYFYQGGSTYAGGSGAGALDRAVRQEAWWAVTSGAVGWNLGDEALWQWTSGAAAAVSTQWFEANNIGNIRTFMESLPGWQTLAPATGSTLITAGRGTRGTQLASGGGGGQYEPATSNNYVSASRTPDSGSGSSLAVMYLPAATTITVDQTKMVTGYVAYWVDPITGTKTSTTAGSTYNSTAKGNNSQGDPDWVLLLQAPSGSASPGAGVAASSAVANAPTVAVTVNAGVATAAAVSNAPQAAVAVKPVAAASAAVANAPAVAVTATSAVAASTATANAPTTAITVNAAVAIGMAVANAATVSTSSGTNAPAGVAAASAVAVQPAIAITANAAVAAATGTALAPSSQDTATAAAATAASVALAPQAAITVTAAVAAAASQAAAPGKAITVNAAVATAQGVALQPVVNTSGSTNAPAAAATATAVANAPAVAITANAAVAAATSAAAAPQAAITVNAAVASSAAVANPATVSTVGSGGASPPAAQALAVAVAPTTAVKVNAGVASASSTALAATRPIFAAVATSATLANAPALAITVTTTAARAFATVPTATGNAFIPAAFGRAAPGGTIVTTADPGGKDLATATPGGQP